LNQIIFLQYIILTILSIYCAGMLVTEWYVLKGAATWFKFVTIMLIGYAIYFPLNLVIFVGYSVSLPEGHWVVLLRMINTTIPLLILIYGSILITYRMRRHCWFLVWWVKMFKQIRTKLFFVDEHGDQEKK